MKIFDYSRIENKSTEDTYRRIGDWFENVYYERFGDSEWPLHVIKALFSSRVNKPAENKIRQYLTNTEMERAWNIMDSEDFYLRYGLNIVTRLMALYGLYSFQIVGDKFKEYSGLTLDDICIINGRPCLRVMNRMGIDYSYKEISEDIYIMIQDYIENNRKNNSSIRLFNRIIYRVSLWRHLSNFKKRMVKSTVWRRCMLNGTPDYMWRRSTGRKKYGDNEIDILGDL